MTEPNIAPRSLIWSPLRWLVIGEVLIFALAAQLAMGMQPPLPADTAASVAAMPWPGISWRILSAIAFGCVMAAMLHALGMHAIRSRSSLFQLLLKYVTSAAGGAILLWLLIEVSAPGAVAIGPVGTSLALSFAVLMSWRLFVTLLIDSAAMRRHVVVLGAGRAAGVFNEAMRRRADRRGLEIVGFIPLAGDKDKGVEPSRLLHSRTSLATLCARNRVREIIIASDDRRGDLPVGELLDCRFRSIDVTQAATFVERECGRIPIELVEPSWWLYRKGFAAGGLRHAAKRVFDFIAGATILVIASPVMLMCAAAIRIEGGAGCSILFRQVRTGLNGKAFRLVKFRSMREDAEGDGIARWATSNDDRVTRVGRFLRKTRLDELPQLFNVLRGDMSLVGPRPERPEFIKDLARQIPYYEQRHVMRPGITGWAQLSYPYGASTRDALEKLKYDLYYIKNHSLAFDITILLRTVEVVLFGKGAR